MKNQHTISVLVENKFGVLSRVSGLFSGRGYNIESLTVSPTNDSAVSKMTIVTTGDDGIIEQIDKQLNKLIDVITVVDLSSREFIEREVLLAKVKTKSKSRSELIELVEIFEGKIVSVHKDELGIELTGRSQKIDDFIAMLSNDDIIDYSRSGRVAISRTPGPTAIY